MKIGIYAAAILGACLTLSAEVGKFNRMDAPGGDIETLRAGFETPPSEAKPLTWWHWINGSVSKEGIEKDFKSFKEAGVAGVQLLNANMYVPDGHLRFHSEDWFDYVNFAIAKADEYGLEFDIMNADGWANSGGPWITPQMSMKRLIWLEGDEIDGGKISMKLDTPKGVKHDFYVDVETYAIPVAPEDGLQPEVKSGMEGKFFNIYFEFSKPVERRIFKITVNVKGKGANLPAKVYSSNDGVNYEYVSDISCMGVVNNVDLDIPFKKTTAKYFKVAYPSHVAKIPDFDTKKFGLSNEGKTLMSGGMKPYGENDSIAEDSSEGSLQIKDILRVGKFMDADGNLKCDLPKGKWKLVRFGYTTTGALNHPVQPEGRGLEVDKMSAKHTRFHIESSLGRTIKESKKYLGKSFKGILLDSWEVGTQDWTDEMAAEFKKLNGYDIMDFLPVLTGRDIVSPLASRAFQSDYRKTISHCVGANYFGEIRRYANENGLMLYGEPYGGACFGEFFAGDNLDVIMSEFWVALEKEDKKGGKDYRVENTQVGMKKTASTSHMTGRKITGAESFTARNDGAKWSKTPIGIKPYGDMAFVNGLNRAIFHTSAHQPNDLKPGFSLGRYGTHFGRANTWWYEAKTWMDFMARSQFMLQSGTPFADVLCMRNDDIERFSNFSMPKIPSGLDFECAVPYVLKTGKIVDDKISFPNGMSFGAIITQPNWEADLETLKILKAAKDAGIPVIGVAPDGPDNLRDAMKNYAQWKALSAALFAPQQEYPSHKKIEELLLAKLKRDFEFSDLEGVAAKPEDFALRAVHRRYGENDFYYVANLNEYAENFTAKFRVARGAPQFWNSVTGEITDVLAYSHDGEYTVLDMSLPALGSSFVVFNAPKKGLLNARRLPMFITDKDGKRVAQGPDTFDFTMGKGVTAYVEGLKYNYPDGKSENFKLEGSPAQIEIKPAEWKVTFISPFGETHESVFKKLISWSDSDDKQTKYFSGTGTYRAAFEIASGALKNKAKMLLNLGEVYEMARVKINGQDAGLVWTHPYEVDVTNLLKEGENTLEISVINTWVNRMIADENLKQDTKYNETGSEFVNGRLAEFPEWYGNKTLEAKRERKTWAIWKHYNGNEPPVKSGLVGPVVLKLGASAK